MKSSIFSLLIRLLICSILTTELISSASFPNPPPLPSPNASPEEWALFMKFLHNYYAIIARPRFGKRYDSGLSPSEQRSLLEMLHQAAVPLSSSVKQLNDVFSENQPIGNHQPINLDDLYPFSQADQRRRR